MKAFFSCSAICGMIKLELPQNLLRIEILTLCHCSTRRRYVRNALSPVTARLRALYVLQAPV